MTTIDPSQVSHLWEGSLLAPLIQWLPVRSQDALLGLRQFDLLVIDSEHTYRTSMWELKNFEPLVKPGGHIMFHDSLFHDGVGHAASTLYASPRFEVITFDTPRQLTCNTIADPVPMGLTVARKIANGSTLPVREELLTFPEHVPDGPFPVVRQHSLERLRDAEG